jgi:hypothetical protein
MNMKIKRSILNKIIKEELENILKLVSDFADLNKFTKEKEYHNEEEFDDDEEIKVAADMNHPILGMGSGHGRKQPSDYLSGGSNERSVSDNIMMGGKDSERQEGCEDLPDIVLKWQRLAESKRR